MIEAFWEWVASVLGLSEDLLTPELKTFVLFAVAIGLVGLSVGQGIGRARGRLSRDSLDNQLEAAKLREAILNQQVAAARDVQQVSEVKAKGIEQQLVSYVGRVREAVDGQLLTRPYSKQSPPPWQRGVKSKVPVIAVANLKGGVGKTTLAANLGAYFADAREDGPQHRKRVLFVDLDFQGSLSETLVNFSGGENFSRSERIFDPKSQVALLWQEAGPLNHDKLVSGCRFFDCDIDAGRTEDRLLFGWAINPSAAAPLGQETTCPRCGFAHADHAATSDPRLALTSLLYNPSVQENFDLVILDMPPRNTLFAFSALAAATHVIVPTKPDQISTRAVSRLFSLLEVNRTMLWPSLESLGVVGMMSDAATLKPHEEIALNAAVDDSNSVWGRPNNKVRLIGHVADRAQIAKIAAHDFAYFDTSSSQPATPHAMFRAIGDEVAVALDFKHEIASSAA